MSGRGVTRAVAMCIGLVFTWQFGCAAQQRAGRVRALHATTQDIQRAYRWRVPTLAHRVLAKELWDQFDAKFLAPAGGVVITEVDILTVDMDDQDARRARVGMRIRWRRPSSVTVVGTMLVLKLEFDEARGGWIITSQTEPGRDGAGPLDLL